MAYEDVLVHSATQIMRSETPDSWVEGEYDEGLVRGTPFECCLFLPLVGEETAPRGARTVTRPTLLLPSTAALKPEDELVIVAVELGLPAVAPDHPSEVRWQVEGHPQPFGPPGEELVGKQVILRRVED